MRHALLIVALTVPMALLACTASGPASTSATKSNVSFKTDVAPMMKASCVACHAPGGEGAGDGVFFTAAGDVDYAAVKASAGRISRQVASGGMPRAGAKWTADQVATFQGWQAAGAQNN